MAASLLALASVLEEAVCSCLAEAVVSSLEEVLLCEEETGFSSLEEAEEEGFSTLEELPVLSEVPFEAEEAGFSSLEEAGFSSLEEAGLSSLEEADVSSLEEAGLSSLEDAPELLVLLEELDAAPLTASSSLLLVTVQSL